MGVDARGLRRDTFNPWHTVWEYAAAHRREPGTPWIFEPGLFPDAKWGGEETGTAEASFATVYPLLQDVGCTHAAVGFNPWHAAIASEAHDGLLRQVAARLGWGVRPAMVWADDAWRTPTLLLVNDGVAPVCGRLVLAPLGGNGEPLPAMELAPGLPLPGRPFPAAIRCPVPVAAVRARVVREGRSYPVRWATGETAGDTLRLRP